MQHFFAQQPQQLSAESQQSLGQPHEASQQSLGQPHEASQQPQPRLHRPPKSLLSKQHFGWQQPQQLSAGQPHDASQHESLAQQLGSQHPPHSPHPPSKPPATPWLAREMLTTSAPSNFDIIGTTSPIHGFPDHATCRLVSVHLLARRLRLRPIG
jgi:hypothetical protein